MFDTASDAPSQTGKQTLQTLNRIRLLMKKQSLLRKQSHALCSLGLVGLLAATSVACSQQAEPERPMPVAPEGTERWVYNEAISDEFEGTSLDTAKWFDHNPSWIGRQPSLFRPENVRVEDGMLILTGRREEVKDAPEGYHTFTTAAVQSTHKVLYGFFEIRCRPMRSALSSAFWLYISDSLKQEEIDIFEICGRHETDSTYPRTYFATSHYILKPQNVQISDHVTHMSDVPWPDRTIVAGFKWTRDELVWYVDGKEIRRRKNDYWHSPETINFDSEAFPTWWGLPGEQDQGGEFQIEYFRYWTDPKSMDELTIFENDMK